MYKLVVDGTLGCNPSPGNDPCQATDWNRYKIDVSRSPTDPNVDDGLELFAYELVFAGRPVQF